ncbi:MAG: hypothetical protein Q9216_007116, partial [Gyalolechia sp. 2 TL-2023]
MYARRLKLMEALERKFAPLEKYHVDVVGLCADTRGEIAFLRKKLGSGGANPSDVDVGGGGGVRRPLKEEREKGEGEGGEGGERGGKDIKNGDGIKDEGEYEPSVVEAEVYTGERGGMMHDDATKGQDLEGVGHTRVKSEEMDERPNVRGEGRITAHARDTAFTSLFFHRRRRRRGEKKDITPTPTRLRYLHCIHTPPPPPPPHQPIISSSSSSSSTPTNPPSTTPPSPVVIPKPLTSRPRRRISKAHRHHPKAQDAERHAPPRGQHQHTTLANGSTGDLPGNDDGNKNPEECWRDIRIAGRVGMEERKENEMGKENDSSKEEDEVGKEKEKEKKKDDDSDGES